MHDFVTRLTVTGLFGSLRHDIKFRTGEEPITILTGANGSGKTHTLNILRSLVAFDYLSFSKLPCAAATLRYASARSLTFENAEPDLLVITCQSKASSTESVTLRILPDPLDEAVPPYMDRLEEDLWIDRTDGELMSTAQVRNRYAPRLARMRPRLDVVEGASDRLEEWAQEFRAPSAPTLVETQRLDARVDIDSPRGRGGRVGTSRIRQYVDQITEQIASAKRASLDASQRADRQFAARALDKARATVQESELRRNYQELAEFNQRLNRNGLTEASAGVEFPGGRTNPTERRILSVFLEDWSTKLEALEGVHEKLDLLRSIVGAKMRGKTLQIDGGQLSFMNEATGASVNVERLSSGEQHLLALFTMLIFTALPGTLVLIDEPEISLHAAWKHAFLEDILGVAKLNDLQVVLATHSSGIVNGNWDLTEELGILASEGAGS